MKICIFTETYYPVMGGGETQAQLLAEGLISRGHSILILTRRTNKSLQKHERYGEVNVYRLGPSGGGQLKKWGLILSGIPALIRLRNHYDLIFVSGYRIIGLAAVLVGRLLQKPVVLKADSQGEMSGKFFESGLKKFGVSTTSLPFRLFLGFRNIILKKANSFSAISKEIAAEWASTGIPPEKIHLIPNSVDTNRFLPVGPEQKEVLRQKLGLSKTAYIAIYTGRLVTYKGLPLLVDVWNDICRMNKNVLLVLAGTGGLDIHNCEQALRAFVKSEGLGEYILFPGSVSNVSEYLQAADLFVFPTENDAFPSSLVEAMACSLPVITTPVGAIKAIVTHRETGLLIEPGNGKQLTQAFNEIFSDAAFAYQMGQAGCRSVQELYSADIVTEKYEALFRNLIRH